MRRPRRLIQKLRGWLAICLLAAPLVLAVSAASAQVYVGVTPPQAGPQDPGDPSGDVLSVSGAVGSASGSRPSATRSPESRLALTGSDVASLGALSLLTIGVGVLLVRVRRSDSSS